MNDFGICLTNCRSNDSNDNLNEHRRKETKRKNCMIYEIVRLNKAKERKK